MDIIRECVKPGEKHQIQRLKSSQKESKTEILGEYHRIWKESSYYESFRFQRCDLVFFVIVVADTSVIKEELSRAKRKLSETQVKCNDFENKCKDIASDLAESSKRETVLRNLLTTVRNQNENLTMELNQVQKNIVDNENLQTKLQNVEKELASKIKFWEFYEEQCLEMKADYIQSLNWRLLHFLG